MTRTPFTILLPELRELIGQENRNELDTFCRQVHPAAVAETVAQLPVEELTRFFCLIDPEPAAQVFHHLPDTLQVEVATRLATRRLARILTPIPPDEGPGALSWGGRPVRFASPGAGGEEGPGEVQR